MTKFGGIFIFSIIAFSYLARIASTDRTSCNIATAAVWGMCLTHTWNTQELQATSGPLPVSPLHANLGCQTLFTVGFLIMAAMGGGTTLEIHGYQNDFLAKMAKAQGFGSAGAALQSIVYQAMSNASIKSAIFDDFHCVHCGSKNPADWVKNRMGKKPHSLDLSQECVAFLSQTILVAVGPPGPSKALQPDKPKRADVNKAARTCIDWAIKEYGEDGKVKGK
jgi:hypothetical protein